jgi:hypothetical protein
MFGHSKPSNARPVRPGAKPTVTKPPPKKTVDEPLSRLDRIEVIEGNGGQTDWALFEAAIREQNQHAR